MKNEYSEFLIKVASDYGLKDCLSKKAFMNPLQNDMFARLLKGALKGLETVSIATFDMKLIAIVKLFQAWMNEKLAEVEKSKQQTQYGAGMWNNNSNDPYNPSNFF